MYNALTRDVERELFPCLRRFGIRFYAYNPLAGGLLTSRYANHAEKPKDGRFVERPHYVDRFWKKSYFDALEVVRAALQKLAEEGGDAPQIDIAEASLTWLRHHSQLKGYLGDGIIIGQSSMAHLESNMRGFERETPLPKPIVTAFDMAWKTCKPDCPQYAR
jgi:aflatoxin B1 aldehyde reductase